MPQEPKKKHSKARKRTRRASIVLKSLATFKCSNCGELTLPHQVCPACGFFKGKLVPGFKPQVKVTKA